TQRGEGREGGARPHGRPALPGHRGPHRAQDPPAAHQDAAGQRAAAWLHGHRHVHGSGADRADRQGHLHDRRFDDRPGEQRLRPSRPRDAPQGGRDHGGGDRAAHRGAVRSRAPDHRAAVAPQSVSSRQELMTQIIRRTLQMVAALAVLTGVAHAQTPLTILTPNGGEIWPVGVRRDIVWSGSTGGNIRIELSRDAGLTFQPLFSNTRDDGVQVWEVEGPAAPNCRLGLTNLDDPTLTATRTADCAIVDAVCGVTVTSPNGGEELLTSTDQLITWAAPGDANIPNDNVRIELSRDGGLTFETLFASTPNDGMEPWTVRGPATGGRIRVTRLSDPTLTDTSDAAFSSASHAVVTAPTGGATWPGKSQELITWAARGDGDVKIELTRDGGLTYETLFASTPNDGSEPWTVTGPPASARIRISHVHAPALEDDSDADFFIASGVTVTAPAGGEIWVIGTQQQITWTASGLGDVSIELSRNGEPFQTIFDRTPNDGAELWTVEGPVTTARIRVTPLDDP